LSFPEKEMMSEEAQERLGVNCKVMESLKGEKRR
jgi:hypothetical protein